MKRALVFAVLFAEWVLPFSGHSGVTLTTLHVCQPSGGTYPFAGLVQDVYGTLYGTTTMTGYSAFSGTVFKMSPDGTLASLYSFFSDPADQTNNGFGVYAGLVPGTDGNLYGATAGALTNFGGTLFRINTNGALTTLFRFNGTNGSECVSSLVRGKDGNFYGTTMHGGTGYIGIQGGYETGYGTIFRLTPTGDFTNLYFFSGGNDGANPGGGLVQSPDGMLYGTTFNGGANSNGTVFKMTTEGALTNLYSFHGIDGQSPAAALVFGKDGYLYGTTQFGGPSTNQNGTDSGTVFRITTTGSFTSMASFDGTNGSQPLGGLLQASDGNFYGTTGGGGRSDGLGGGGTVFRVSPDGALTTVYVFQGDDGYSPGCTLLQAADGNFYGTTMSGGYNHDGTIFRLSVPLPPVFQCVNRIGTNLLLTWSSVAGQSYQLQYITDSSKTNWTSLGTPIVATNGNTAAADSIGSDTQRFYRVVLQP